MNNPRDGKGGIIQLLITGVRVGLIVSTLAATLSMVTFAQTTKPAIESTPAATKVVVTNDSLKHDKKSTESDTSVQIDPPTVPSISAADNIEIQHRFNELRRELLDNRASDIDRWLSVITIVLTFLGIVVVVGGYIGFKRFREIETEAKNSVEIVTQHAEAAKHHIDEIEKNRNKSAEIIQAMNAEAVANDPEEAKQAATNVRANPMASLIDKAIAQAVFLQQQGKRDEAIEKWRAVAHIVEEVDNDLAARAWFSVGYLLENPEDRISAYDRAITLKRDFVEAYNNRGNAKVEQGRYKEAIVDYDEAIRLKSDFVAAYHNRGIAKGRLGHYEDAIADYDETIRLKSDFADAYYNRGIAKGKLGHYEDAIVDYDEAIRLKLDSADAYYSRGSAKDSLSHYEDAIADYDEAIRLKPDYIDAYHNRGFAKGRLGHHEDAIADYDEAIRLKPDDADAYYNRGNAKAKLEQYADAITDFDKAIRLKPDDAEAYNNRGNAKSELEQYADAIADFDKAIRLKPDFAEAYYNRGTDKAVLGVIDAARQDFEKARDLARDAGNNRLADAIEQRLRDLDSQEDE